MGQAVKPEHVHLFIGEPERGDPSRAMQALKQGFARHVLRPWRDRRRKRQADLLAGEGEHVWQKRFYDFNVWTERKRIEKLRYMHQNPVRRRLVLAPEHMDVEQLSQLCLVPQVRALRLGANLGFSLPPSQFEASSSDASRPAAV